MKGAERIYVYPEFTHSCTERGKGDVEYIRADIVEELVGALEKIIEEEREQGMIVKALVNIRKIAKTALAKIKEET